MTATAARPDAAGPRRPRRGRRAASPRHRGGSGDPPGRRPRGRRGDRDERRPGRRPAVGLRDRRRRVLADLGRGRRPPDRAERLRARARRPPTPAALRARRARDAALRGPLAITVPGAVRSWGDAHARHGRLSRAEVLAPAIELAWRRLPGLGRVHLGGRGRRCRPSSRRSVRAPGSSRSIGRTAGPGGPASGSGCRPSRRPSSGSPRSASTTSTTARSPSARRPGWPRVGCRITARRPRGPTPRPGRSRSRPTIAASGSRPTRRTVGDRRPRAAEHPRDVRAAGRRRRSGRPASTTRAGSTSGSRRRSWRWPTATST